jgi:predicted RNase H-like nuclease
MVKSAEDIWLAGVDGCKGGWLVVLVRPEGQDIWILDPPLKHFADVLARAAIVAVDMPVGLPRCGGRAAEILVRPLLKTLSRSVFPIPSRLAVFAEIGPFANEQERYAAHQRACLVAAETSNPPKRIPIQTFGIFPKIREVDECLRSTAGAIDRVFEVHPEVAFWRLNGGQELTEPKKRNGRPHFPGLSYRRQLLRKAGLPNAAIDAEAPRGASDDDLLDALACAAIARRIHSNKAQPFPNPPERDECGIPMAIWA